MSVEADVFPLVLPLAEPDAAEESAALAAASAGLAPLWAHPIIMDDQYGESMQLQSVIGESRTQTHVPYWITFQ